MQTKVVIENNIIQLVEVEDGCDGNLKGVCALLQGRNAIDAVALLRGIRCDQRSTSCPDQIALCIEEALASGTK